MRIARLRRILGVALALALSTLLVWVGLRLSERRTGPPANHEIPRSAGLEVTGLSLAFFDGERHQVSLHADRLVHKSRRIGPLTIRPLKEIELSGVRLVLDDRAYDADRSAGDAQGSAARTGADPAVSPGRRSEDAARPLEESILPATRLAFEKFLTLSDLGFVSRLSVIDCNIEVLQSGVRSASLHAGRLRIDRLGSGFTLEEGIELLSPSGDRLEAREARWDSGAGRLVLTGGYLLRRGGKARSGTGGPVSFGPSGEIVLD